MKNPHCSEMKKARIQQDFKDIFTNRIWSLDLEGVGKVKRRLVRFIKLARVTLDSFAENRMGFQCVALSYFATFAIVPFLAFIFAVSDGLGISDFLHQLLLKVIPANTSVINAVMGRANNIIEVARSSAVGLVGAITFLWAIIWLMFQVERVFNNVWGIRKIPRKIYKRFSYYIMLLVLSPFLVLIFGAGIAFYTNVTKLIGLDLGDLNFLPVIFGWLCFYGIAVMTLSAMYKYIPATFVRYRYALKSALVSAAVFTIFQYLYLETQVFVTRLNAVYGAIAAIPLFMMWMNYSWQIIMYGAQLTYGFQNVDNYHLPEGENETDKE